MWRLILGIVFVPDSIGFLLGTNIFGMINTRLGSWKCAMASLPMAGAALFLVKFVFHLNETNITYLVCRCMNKIPFARALTHLIIPHLVFGLALGCVDACMYPLLGQLVDERHGGDYGSVYAISQFSVGMAFALGRFLNC